MDECSLIGIGIHISVTTLDVFQSHILCVITHTDVNMHRHMHSHIHMAMDRDLIDSLNAL